ncbi:MAG: HD domain-containing protein [Bacteroidales bacterium]|nr:HD domain-containing protein [Bacteroidales bacterium]
MKSEKEIIEEVSHFVEEAVKHHDSGHGWSHIERVRRLALHIHEREGRGNREIIELGALMHDVGDHKFSIHAGPAEIRKLLAGLGVDAGVIEEVVLINEEISFSKGKRPAPEKIELQIVQDADRLDAMGAVGIARAFSYGGLRGREIYDPREKILNPPLLPGTSSHSASTVHHFYDKLLMLKNLMNTPTGRELARERHDFMLSYLDQFFREWNAEGDM